MIRLHKHAVNIESLGMIFTNTTIAKSGIRPPSRVYSRFNELEGYLTSVSIF
jgi:hypothetical protein